MAAHVGDWLKTRRVGMQLSLSQMGDKAGLSKSYIYDIERCKCYFRTDDVEAIANAYLVHKVELLARSMASRYDTPYTDAWLVVAAKVLEHRSRDEAGQ